MNQSRAIAGFAILVFLLTAASAGAQSCTGGLSVEGTVFDPTGAVIAGALVKAGSASATTNKSGQYELRCINADARHLSTSANGFETLSVVLKLHAGQSEHYDFHLKIARVESSVSVSDGEGPNLDADHGMGTHVLTEEEIHELSDDPDDFQRELQILAAANGGAPGAARITVDGFQNSSTLPPKASIARIVTAPDLFSAEYDTPPYAGGRVEIFTKPGADSLHGALFLTDSDGAFNATDPFSTVATPAGRRRYGFELGGPIVKAKSDYFLALEKRDIDEFNVVDATTLDANGDPFAFHQTVAAPQRLWIASARADLQAGKSDVLALTFSANTNSLSNQGIGGLALAESGYDSVVSEYDLRLTNTETISSNLLHETHAAWTWKDTADAPLSATPSINVAGYFIGGGNTAQQLNDRERDLEIDEDFLYARGKHTWKIGAQSLGIFVHDVDPDTFNGAFTFGGGSAPVLDANGNPTGQTTTIGGLEQYRRALLDLPGGTPTEFAMTAGTALVPFTQWQLAFYAEDTVKVNSRLTLSGGLRYALETSPGTFLNFAPRAGLAWVLDKHSRTIVHLHAGLFSSVVPASVATEDDRLNGQRQTESLIYFPSFAAPLTPTGQSIDVTTVRSLPASLSQTPSFQSGIGIEHTFPRHWHAQANLYSGEAWNMIRSRNINAPLISSALNQPPNLATALAAPRPIAANENIFQFEDTGHLHGDAVFLGLDQHGLKRFSFFLGYLNFNFTTDTNNGGFAQSAYSNQGEAGPPDWQSRNRVFFFGNLNLPRGVQLSSQFDADSGLPYNPTTGTDNNGDGVFNDRPSYADAQGAGIFSTPFGLLSENTVNGNVPRDLGTMPTLVHLDTNLSRAWKIGRNRPDRPSTLTINLRTANLLNHTNVTAVSSIVSSPVFAQPVAAESARRVELGARFAF